MKKLFFTAIALVAFSGVSMAGTIEIETSDIFNEFTEVNLDDNCTDTYHATYIAAEDNGANRKQAAAVAFAAYKACRGLE